MYTIGELSRISRLSVRALRYYDQIGLLSPVRTTDAGYRLYDDNALQRLHTIMLFRELEFPLTDIRRILDTPGFDPLEALETQITLLTMKRDHIDNLILLARGLKMKGMNNMHVTEASFDAFDHHKIDDYVTHAKAAWNQTDAYKEYERKHADRTADDEQKIEQGMVDMMAYCGQYRHLDPVSDTAQALVQQLRDYITEHFYNCTPLILRYLADMYDGGGDFTRNIDQTGGEGTAAFLGQAIRHYCAQHASEG